MVLLQKKGLDPLSPSGSKHEQFNPGELRNLRILGIKKYLIFMGYLRKMR